MSRRWQCARYPLYVTLLVVLSGSVYAQERSEAKAAPTPVVILDRPAPHATVLRGRVRNYSPEDAIVVYALTNEYYVQPTVAQPITAIASNGTWTCNTNPWAALVVLLVNPSNYTPQATEITNPALDPNVIAYTTFPPGPITVNFSGRTWGIKQTGNVSGYAFDPGPNYWSNSPAVVRVERDGLRMRQVKIKKRWQCAEVYLTESLGYGTYTVQIASHLDNLGINTVAAPLFLYAGVNEEIDNEYSGLGGLIPSPNDAQFVVQPPSPSTLNRYVQLSTPQFTSQMVWQSNQTTFTTWNGWSPSPGPSDTIAQWTYMGNNNIPVGQERVHINLWLNGGNPPASGRGDEMVLHSFSFAP